MKCIRTEEFTPISNTNGNQQYYNSCKQGEIQNHENDRDV